MLDWAFVFKQIKQKLPKYGLEEPTLAQNSYTFRVLQ